MCEVVGVGICGRRRFVVLGQGVKKGGEKQLMCEDKTKLPLPFSLCMVERCRDFSSIHAYRFLNVYGLWNHLIIAKHLKFPLKIH